MGAKGRKNKIPSNKGQEREKGTRREKGSENQYEDSQKTTDCILKYITDMKKARDDTKRKQNMESALNEFSQKIKVINDENLVKIFKTFKQSYIKLDIEDKKDFNEHLMKKLFEFAKLKKEDKDKEAFYETLASSIIITILNDPNIKKNYKTIPNDLLGRNVIDNYDTFSDKFIKKTYLKEHDTSSKKHDTSSKEHKQKRISEIQKLFFCIISTAKIAFYSETPKKFELNDSTSIIKNFLGKYHVNLEEDLGINFIKSTDSKKGSQTNIKSDLQEAYQKVIKDSIITPTGQNVDDCYELQNEHKLTVEGEFLTERDVDFYIHFKKDCKIKISDGFEIPILAGTEIIIEIDGPNHFAGFITPKNLKDAQQTILGQTVFRNDSIKRNFKKSALEEKSDSEEMTRGNLSLKDKLQNMIRNLKDKSASLLQYACRLEKFKQRRKIDNPEIIPIKSQETTKNSNAPQEPIDLTEKNEDLIGVTAHSIRNSNLFFSIPGLKDQYRINDKGNKVYYTNELSNTFKNCLINAYYSQALSNLKEFYRQETKNTQSTQPGQQEQNREETAKYEEKDKIKEEKLEQEELNIKVDISSLSKKDNSESMTNTDSTKYIPDNISPLSPIASHDTLTSNSSSLTILSPTEFESYKTPETPRTPRTS